MKRKLIILSSIAVIGVTAILSLGAFSEPQSQHEYLSLTATTRGNTYVIYIIDEKGKFEKLIYPGTPGRKNDIEWKKQIWKKVNEMGLSGYKLISSNEGDLSSDNPITRARYVFEKE